MALPIQNPKISKLIITVTGRHGLKPIPYTVTLRNEDSSELFTMAIGVSDVQFLDLRLRTR